jgi:hypothetical protein
MGGADAEPPKLSPEALGCRNSTSSWRCPMADLPYVINSGTLPKFFSTIQTTGVPGKVNLAYLTSIGFKSSNDRYLVPFLKDMQFAEPNGNPTERWKSYRHTAEAKVVMAAAIRGTWSGLYDLYSDAHNRDDEAVRNWMRTFAPKASPTTVDRSLKTFRAVSGLADFENAAGEREASSGRQGVAEVLATAASSAPAPRSVAPEVVINIQLQVPATNDPETYDRFFAAMKQHLFSTEP